MEPYYSDKWLTIYHGDCGEVLPSVGSVDLVATDPPYGVAYRSNRISSWEAMAKRVNGDHSLDTLSRTWKMCVDALHDNRHYYCFASPRLLPQVMAIVATKQVLAWDKGDAGTVGDLESGFGEAWEAICYGMKGRRPLRGKRPRSIVRIDWSSRRDPVHPTVKPVPLLEKLILWSTDPNEVVLDPFCGSGTTLRAARECGRRAIGIEIDERYCEIAANRQRQGMLF